MAAAAGNGQRAGRRRPGRQSQARYEGAGTSELREIFLGQAGGALELVAGKHLSV
jgi:hypothetical protein